MSAIAPKMAPKKVRCPRCATYTVYSTENSFRPFCSERCKLMDLGAWASGEYSIPGGALEVSSIDATLAREPPPSGTNIRH